MTLKAIRRDDYFDDAEAMSAGARQQYQERKLHKTLKNAFKHSLSARNIMSSVNITPANIRTPKGLQKLPVTRKNDIIELQKTNPPYSGLLTLKPEEVERVYVSPDAVCLPFYSSKIKWFARSFWTTGFRKGDLVLNTFGNDSSSFGMLYHEALRECGATAVTVLNDDPKNRLQVLRDFNINGFVGTFPQLMDIINQAGKTGVYFREDIALERAWLGGELLTASERQILEEDHGIDPRQAFTVPECGGTIAYECPRKSGFHFEDDYIIEVVNPATGAQLPPGETGEIVITPINNKAWGLLRYGTGITASYTTEPCACGRTSYRLIDIQNQGSNI